MPLKLQRILLCTDFSDAAQRALDVALPIARVFDAKLTLIHVWSAPASIYAEALSWPVEGLEGAARRALEELVAKTAEAYAPTVGMLDAGEPCERILHYVDTHAIDLVVVGPHARHGLPRVVIGSVAEKIVRLSPVPVLTVHEK